MATWPERPASEISLTSYESYCSVIKIAAMARLLLLTTTGLSSTNALVSASLAHKLWSLNPGTEHSSTLRAHELRNGPAQRSWISPAYSVHFN